MATNKEKLLQSVQKNLKKKQVSKAIKDYIKIIELDPADVRQRQKLAELYVRTNKKAEAYEQYEAIAKDFTKNGFYLKAIAIYKQMQRLDPGQVTILIRLAELNEKQGLVGNAISEYRNLVEYYERAGMPAEEIKTLEKMRELDQNNLNVRVKLAEVYTKNGRKEDGLREIEDVFDTLGDKGEFDKQLRLFKMFQHLYADNSRMQMKMVSVFYEKDDYAGGVAVAEKLLSEKPDDPDLLRLLALGYVKQNDPLKAQSLYKQLLAMDPTDLDLRAALVRCQLDSGKFQQALNELEEWKEAFFKESRVEILKEYYEQLSHQLDGNAVVRETLDSIHTLTGDEEQVIDFVSPRHKFEEPEPEEVDLADSLLGSLDSDIAPVSDEEEPQGDSLSFAVSEDDSFDVNMDMYGEAEEDELPDGDSFIELEIDSDLALDEDGDESGDFFFDVPESSVDDDVMGAEVTEKEEEPEPEVVGRDPRNDLEEAEFYLRQGLYDEAERLCRGILAYASDSDECRRKLDEIAVLKAEAQATAAGTSEKTPADKSAGDDFLFDLSSLLDDDVSEKKVFRTDVDEQIGADYMESHYNLGIAYREMGLFEDAISEFDKASRDPSRYVDCQTLKGLCHSDKGEFAAAEKMFRLALDP
ncbi:MAG: hypothetical protein C0622_05025, partial [Desulfuromonas sp.]